jgi:hypothetical protein
MNGLVACLPIPPHWSEKLRLCKPFCCHRHTRRSKTGPNPFKSMNKIAECHEASGGLVCCGQQKAFLIEKRDKLHDIAPNLVFGDTELCYEIVNNLIE